MHAALGGGGGEPLPAGCALLRLPFFDADAAARAGPAFTTELALRCAIVMVGVAKVPRLSVATSMLDAADKATIRAVAAATAAALPASADVARAFRLPAASPEVSPDAALARSLYSLFDAAASDTAS